MTTLRRWLVAVVVARGMVGCIWAGTSLLEDWNSDLLRNHTWSYYHATPGANGDYDANWSAAGGVGDTGHINTPLDQVTQVQGGYYPFYLYSPDRMQPEQHLTLSPTSVISASFRSDAGFDWKGAQLYFFVGAFDSGTGNQAFFYRQVPFSAPIGSYAFGQFTVGAPSGWTRYFYEYHSGQDITLQSIFLDVPQYGFVLYGASSTPSGTLRLDNFEVVPEPATSGVAAGLLCAGLAACRRVDRLRATRGAVGG